ncbi:MAG: hypothetical protein M1830_001689, partial [Pleopsidium flavum]
FLCPNCRAVTDLEADADDPYDYEEQGDEEADDSADSNGTEKARPSTGSVASNGVDAGTGPTQLANGVTAQKDAYHDISEDMTTRVATASVADDGLSAEEPEVSSSLLSRRNVSSNSMLQHGINATQPVPLTGRTSPRSSNSGTDQDGDTSQLTEPSSTLRATTPTAGETLGPEGPMTPRNDAGPFVFDGSAGRASGRRAVASLAEAATETTESGT